MTQSRNNQLNIRFSEEEYDKIQIKADENNMTLPEYVREKIFFDVPIIERNSFEFKVLKTLSFCAGILAESDYSYLSDEDKEAVDEQIDKVLITNGIDPDEAERKI